MSANEIAKRHPFAFPITGSSWCDDTPGLTKRELFAAMTMQGLITCGCGVGDMKASVLFADALIEALEK